MHLWYPDILAMSSFQKMPNEQKTIFSFFRKIRKAETEQHFKYLINRTNDWNFCMHFVSIKTNYNITYFALLWPFFSTASSKIHFHLQCVKLFFLNFQPEKTKRKRLKIIYDLFECLWYSVVSGFILNTSQYLLLYYSEDIITYSSRRNSNKKRCWKSIKRRKKFQIRAQQKYEGLFMCPVKSM